jgi:hypothetical protein
MEIDNHAPKTLIVASPFFIVVPGPDALTSTHSPALWRTGLCSEPLYASARRHFSGVKVSVRIYR